MHKKIFKLDGLSLIEILITITIVAILATISIYSYKDYKRTAMYNSALAIIEQSKLKISAYYIKNQKCPNDNFINITQPYNSSSVWTEIKNEVCSIKLSGEFTRGTKEEILTFKVNKVNSFGELLYYCNYPASKKEVAEYVPKCLDESSSSSDPYSTTTGTPVNTP